MVVLLLLFVTVKIELSELNDQNISRLSKSLLIPAIPPLIFFKFHSPFKTSVWSVVSLSWQLVAKINNKI